MISQTLMKQLTRSFTVRASAVLLAAIALTRSTQAAIPAPERLLPDDTLVLITVPDFNKARTVWNSQPSSKAWSDPALKPFREHLISKLQEEIVKPMERELSVNVGSYAELLQGQLTFAVTKPAAGTKEPGVLILLDSATRGEQLKTNIANLKRKWLDAGKSLKTEKVRDVEFSVMPLAQAEMPEFLKKFSNDEEDEEADAESSTNKTSDELVFGQFESLLIVGNSVKAVETVAIRLSAGAAPTLADSAAFESSRSSILRETPLIMWANTKALLSMLIDQSKSEEEENPMSAMFSLEKIFNATGLLDLRTIVFSMQLTPDGVSAQAAFGIPESSRKGVFKLLPTAGKDSMPPAFVPADVSKFQRVRIDGQAAWKTLRQMFEQFSPEMSGSIDFMINTANEAARQKDPDFDLNKNLFGNLGDDIIAYEKAAKGNTLMEISSAPTVFLIGSPKPEQLASGFRTLVSLMNPQAATPAEREFLGRKIYSIPLPSSPMAEQASTNKLSYAATSDYLAISTDEALLEEFLRSGDAQQKPLREKEGLNDAIAKAGGGSTGWLQYENQVETMRTVFEFLRQNKDEEPAMLAPGIPAFTPDNPFTEWFDFSLLPPFEQIAKYFSFAVIGGNTTSDGFVWKMYGPTPPELRK